MSAQPREGFFGYRNWWPAGLSDLTPAGRAKALKLGRWPDGEYVITRDGDRRHAPREAASLYRRLA